MTPRILGYTMARDEWPLLGVAITHALITGVDHIVVVDHASVDGTATGLTHLQEAWPGRVTVFRLCDGTYLQEATTSTIMAAIDAQQFDWVYIFDADEFLLTSPGTSLHDLVEQCPIDAAAVRYEVHQWVAPVDMDDAKPDHFGRITHRALPCLFTNPPGNVLAHDVENGMINFFDIPFLSKVIVRGQHAHSLTAGAHALSTVRPYAEFQVDPKDLRVGHLPLLSQRRLLLKCQQGQALADAGFPTAFGWQSQMLRRVEIAGNLQHFWDTHSIPQGSTAPPSGSTPSTMIDPALADALERAIVRCDPRIWTLEPAPPSDHQMPEVSLDRLVQVVHALKSDREAVVADRDAVVADRDALAADRDAVVADRDALAADRDAVVADRDAVVADRDALAAHREALLGEQMTLREQISAFERSRIWRGTAWYRRAKKMMQPKPK